MKWPKKKTNRLLIRKQGFPLRGEFSRVTEELTSFRFTRGGREAVKSTGGTHRRCSLLFQRRNNPIVFLEFGSHRWQRRGLEDIGHGPKLQRFGRSFPAGERESCGVGGFTALQREGEEQIFARKLPWRSTNHKTMRGPISAPFARPRSSLRRGRHQTTRCIVVGGWGLSGKNDESVLGIDAMVVDFERFKGSLERSPTHRSSDVQ